MPLNFKAQTDTIFQVALVIKNLEEKEIFDGLTSRDVRRGLTQKYKLRLLI